MPRIIFMGSPAFAVPSLSALCERPDLCEVVAVVTQPDKPAGRGRKLAASAVKIAAMARGVPVLQPTKMKPPQTQAALAAHRPDLMVVAAYGRILPPNLLALPRLGCINVHASLLPRHRGASPIAHAIIAGDAETGVCIMQMDAGLDTGPVYARATTPITPQDTCGSLTVALAKQGAELLIATLPAIAAGSATPEPQDDGAATYAPLLAKGDGKLDFSQPADLLERRVRGLNPWPGSFALRDGERVQVLAAEVVAHHGGSPGAVIAADRHGVTIACGDNALRWLSIKPAGRQQMTAAAWVAGRGVAVGDRFA